jgi:hypothetical protein
MIEIFLAILIGCTIGFAVILSALNRNKIIEFGQKANSNNEEIQKTFRRLNHNLYRFEESITQNIFDLANEIALLKQSKRKK